MGIFQDLFVVYANDCSRTEPKESSNQQSTASSINSNYHVIPGSVSDQMHCFSANTTTLYCVDYEDVTDVTGPAGGDLFRLTNPHEGFGSKRSI